MNTVVYPLKNQSDYTELKYSLRSIDRFLKKPFEVVIVGDKMPGWINNVTQIGLGDMKSQNNFSVGCKVVAALEYSKKIFFMNDDIYLLREADWDFPYYTSGTLKTKGESGARALMKQLEKLNRPIKYFGHYPAVYEKDFSEALSNFTDEVPTKSAYLNFLMVDSIEISDCKLVNEKKPKQIIEFIKDKPYFSTGIHSLKSCLPILDKLFPVPSIYEI